MPSPEAIAIERMTASAPRSLTARPSTLFTMNGSMMALIWRAASSPAASAHDAIVATVAGLSGSIRSSIFPPSSPPSAMAEAV